MKNHQEEQKDEVLFSLEIFHRVSNRTAADNNSIWQQVMSSLNDQPSIRDLFPTLGGLIAK